MIRRLRHGLHVWGITFRFQAKQIICSPNRPHRPSGPHTFLFKGIQDLFLLGVKRQRREADHSRTFSSKVKNDGSYVSIFPHAFIRRTQTVSHSPFSLIWTEYSQTLLGTLGFSMQCDLVSAYTDLTVAISLSDQVGVRGEVALAPYRLHTVQDR